MLKITSRDNPKLKLARKVRDRKLTDLIFIEGRRLAEETLRSNIKIIDVFLAKNFEKTQRENEFLDKLAAKNVLIYEVSEKIFPSLADTKTSQGIILIGEKPKTEKPVFEAAFSDKIMGFPLAILLHEINNPSNLGAILRTAEAANISGMIISKNSAEAFSPRALRASMGAALRLPIWERADFGEVLAWAKEKNLVLTAADVNARKSYTEIDWKKPRLLVFGSEARGLGVAERENIEESLVIPMENRVESLNLAVSCGIIIYEAKRQNNLDNQ
jgi:RNA methyltransferase, TrmH family